MRHSVLTIALLLGAFTAASAQELGDVRLFSDNVYTGTARTAGMGNAVSAVGGDVGSIGINPAGSAVAGYSQFVFTPGISISSMTAEGTVFSGMTDPVGLGDRNSIGYARGKIPNMGFVISSDTGRRSGLKRISLGVLSNATYDYTGKFISSGVNLDNSYAASLASSADGFLHDVLGKEDWFYSGDPSRMPLWEDMAGYRGRMFNMVDGQDGAYVALTEAKGSDGKYRLAAPIYQEYGQRTNGFKHDMVINAALNFSDILYIGANLGMSYLVCNRSTYWQEEPDNPSEYPTIAYSDGTEARFNWLRMQQNLRTNGTGVYFKLGVLVRPVAGLRLAAAIQTPTLYTISETYAYQSQVSLSGLSTGEVNTPEGESRYSFRSPMRFNAGAAYSFKRAVLSVDYELCNFAAARFSSYSDDDFAFGDHGFTSLNDNVRDSYGVSHQIRLGGEFRLTPNIALRGGYNLITAGEQGLDMSYASHIGSLGFGWSSDGPFFVDAAVRIRSSRDTYYTPYYYYTYDRDNGSYLEKYIDDSVITPEVRVSPLYFDGMVTLGWRF